MDHLSRKNIPSRERLIFALDVPTVAEGKQWVEKLGDSVVFYKLGLQLFMAGGYYEFIDWLAARGKEDAYVGPGAFVDPAASVTGSIVGEGAVVRGAGALRDVVVWPGATVEAPLARAVVLASGKVVRV